MAEEMGDVKSSAGASSPHSPRNAAKQPSSPRSPKQQRRAKLTEQQLENCSKDELAAKWRELDSYVESLEARTAAQEGTEIAGDIHFLMIVWRVALGRSTRLRENDALFPSELLERGVFRDLG